MSQLKKSPFIFIFIIIFILNTANVFADTSFNFFDDNNNTAYISDDIKNTKENSTSITGSIPKINSIKANINIDNINIEIQKIYNQKIKEAADSRSKSLAFSYTIFKNIDYLSILITSKNVNAISKTEASSITIDLQSGKIISIEDFTQSKSLDVINSYLNYFMEENPDSYNKNFGGVSLNSSFYIENNNLVLIFDSYQFISTDNKLYTITVPFDSFEKFILRNSEYKIDSDNFNIKLIPIRKVCESNAFGYNVYWNNEARKIILKNIKDQIVISLTDNEYTIKNKKVTLESPPIIKLGVTYVPISFFRDALNIPFAVDNNNNIIFYKFS